MAKLLRVWGHPEVKDNLQLKADYPLANQLNEVVIQALWRTQPFQSENSEIVNSN
jgi:predicted 2-oxoglutarate/Fe(II)-dependent dioxygenase YbiX